MKTKEQIEMEMDAAMGAIAERLTKAGKDGAVIVVTGVVMYATFRHGGEDRATIVANMVAAEDNPGITAEDMEVLANVGEQVLANHKARRTNGTDSLH